MSPADPGRSFGQVRLGTLEQQVMEQLWEQAELTIRELISRLGDEYAYTTIATVLKNLDRKGLVSHRRAGRSVQYRARHSRSEHAAQLMEHALSASNDRSASILRFVDGMQSRDLAMLRAYLDGHEASPPPEDGQEAP